MLQKTIKFEDYNGNSVSQDFWFHMNKADIAEFKYRKDGSDMVDVISRIMTTENIRGVLDILKEIARAAVGRKSEDGTRFIKDDEARSELFDTDAYSELMYELLSNENNAAKFIQGILPKDMAKQVEQTKEEYDVHNMTKEQIAAKMRELQEQQRALGSEAN